MADHTKEPWAYLRIEPQTASADFSEPYSPWIAGAGPRAVAVGKSICIHADDMRRIVACVNACAGFKTEAIEAGVVNPAAQEQALDTLRARVAELEAKLKVAEERTEYGWKNVEILEKERVRLETALAKIKEAS